MKLVLILFLAFPGLACAFDLFSENFESGGPGSFGVVETGGLFSYPEDAEGGAVPTRSVFFKGTTGVELKLENDGGFSALPANSVFEVAFDYFEPGFVAGAGLGDALRVRVGDAIGNGGTLIDLGLANGTMVQSDGSNLTSGAYAEDRLVRVRLMVNNTEQASDYGSGLTVGARSFDVLVDGARVLRGGTFRNAIAKPDGMSFNKFSSGKQEAYVDNVVVSVEGGLPVPAVTVYPSFHAASLHWSPPGKGVNVECMAEYREVGSGAWKSAQPLPYIPWGGLYRGSVVGLEPGTAYEFRLSIPGGVSRIQTATTRSDVFPENPLVVTLPAFSGTTRVISSGGTSGGWKVYEAGPEGSVIDVENSQDYAVRITSDYVILRGVTAKGGRIGVIQLADNVRHVLIEGCDLSDWGRNERLNFGVREDPAIGGRGNGDIVIQGNLIHSPRWDANEWTEPNGEPPTTADGRYYPTGAAGISLKDSRGEVVIRYNHIDSPDDEFRIMDAIQVLSYNQSNAPGRGTDVYGNKITNLTDDAIELEGWETNFRVWGNYIDRGYTSISLRTVFEGPSYVFRNVGNRYLEIPASKFGKTGNQNAGRTCGPQYWYHNTMLDAGPGQRAWQGIWYQHDSNQAALEMEFLNNILVTRDQESDTIYIVNEPVARRNDFDLYQGQVPAGSEENGFDAPAAYRTGHGPVALDSGKYQISQGTPGHDGGILIKNFNNTFLQNGPDIGAAENGEPAMKFGLEAYEEMLAGYPVPGFVAFTGGGIHPDEDRDDDGASAIMEYALGGSLTAPDHGLTEAVGKTFGFSREASATDVGITIEDSIDMAAWTPRSVSQGGSPFASDPGYGVSETPGGKVTLTAPEGTRRFFRLRFSYP